ncbi:MAG: aminopeptidase N [Elusimicrobia bacterium]|nr:aminopeptidase N [Elusimicrobiota bacterium]
MKIGLAIFASLFASLAGIVEARPASRGLREEDARARAVAVGGVEYDLHLNLDPNSPEFSGKVVTRFDWTGSADSLTVDFDSGTIESLRVNGQSVTVSYNGYFLSLPAKALRRGANTAEMVFRHAYDRAGKGLYRFKDPEDGLVYLYSMFEPYDANKMWPSFDQPDIKAKLRLSVEAPAEWIVVSTSREQRVERKADRALWSFPQTPRLSPYVLSLHAGPYRVWESTAGKIPLRLMARRSLARHVEPEEWFRVTRQGLEFFGKYFDYPYPFGKYDQVIVPDFNYGAMENVAAVTFSEDFVRRGKPRKDEREALAGTILHEMAHMWFGDLVTMRWWNGLWLNESFATYMAAMAAFEATEFKEAWQSFSGIKRWAYWEDQQPTTHPIDGPVPDTMSAFTRFDGITYGKGAAALKQLAFALGPEAFRDGVRAYLKSWAYGNAELEDFFAALGKVAGRDLRAWTREWLETSGVNAIRAQYRCEAGRVSDFRLQQSASGEHPTLKRHKTLVALFRRSEKGLELDKAIGAEYEGKETEVTAARGVACPDFVFPNDDDYDYVKVEIDERSLRAIEPDLQRIAYPLLRQMVWHEIWQMVRDARFAAWRFERLALQELERETDFKVLSALAQFIHGRSGSSPSLLRYLGRPSPGFDKAFWRRLDKEKPGTDAQKLFFDSFVNVASTGRSMRRLEALLDGRLKLPGMDIDQDRRWAIIAKLNAAGREGAWDRAQQEARRDPSERGVKSLIIASASRPEMSVKRDWFSQITAVPSPRPMAELRSAVAGLFPPGQSEQLRAMADEFFQALPRLDHEADEHLIDDFAEHLAPALCSEDSVRRLSQFLDSHPGLGPAASRALRIARHEDERCVQARRFGSRAI